MLVDLSSYGPGRGVFVQLALEHVKIVCNKNAVPGDLASPFYPSGIRIGTPALTSDGWIEESMITLAKILHDVIERVMDIVDNDSSMELFPEGYVANKPKILCMFREKIENENIFADINLQTSDIIKRNR
jgi:glycine/serine hydroxymethyltransferase